MCVVIDAAVPADRNVMQKEAEKTKIQEFVYRDTTNVEYEMCDYTGNSWSHRNNNERFQKVGSHSRKTFSRFSTKDSCTWNVTHNTESTAV
jgi:hypothetical protein